MLLTRPLTCKDRHESAQRKHSYGWNSTKKERENQREEKKKRRKRTVKEKGKKRNGDRSVLFLEPKTKGTVLRLYYQNRRDVEREENICANIHESMFK